MRSLYFTAAESGLTRSQLRWGETQGRWRRIARGVWRLGADPVTDLDRAIALSVATDSPASGTVAGVLHGYDGVRLGRPEVTRGPADSHGRPGVRRRAIAPDRVVSVAGVRCLSPLQTLLDLAVTLDDDHWEQALESALRKRLLTVPELVEAALPAGTVAPHGAARLRRVLDRRPTGAPPTESLLETLFVQLARRIPGVGEPVRQLVIRDEHGEFVARLDLAWPELGLFIELDGQQHRDQPVYDARRETAVIAATGWLVGRFTWDEVTRHPAVTVRRLADLVAQARRRPAAAS